MLNDEWNSLSTLPFFVLPHVKRGETTNKKIVG